MALKKWSTEIAILVAEILTFFFLYVSWGDPWGGWAFGPRYMIPVMSILSIFVAYFLDRTRFQILSKLLALPLIAFSVGVSLIGALTTNQIPPKSEAIVLGIGYNFFRNWEFVMTNQSSSYVFNTFFKQQMSLQQYGIYLFGAVMAAVFIIMCIIPLFERRKQHVGN